jgi:hypothetical protein
MGNDEASNLICDFIEIKNSYLTPNEIEMYPKKTPRHLQKTLIERSIDRLINHSYKTKSRLAFMILGRYLMQNKIKITEELRQTILKYSDWKYEEKQLKNERDRKERKRFLDDFRKKIENYDGTKIVKIPYYTVAQIIEKRKEEVVKTPLWRQNIDYSI